MSLKNYCPRSATLHEFDERTREFDRTFFSFHLQDFDCGKWPWKRIPIHTSVMHKLYFNNQIYMYGCVCLHHVPIYVFMPWRCAGGVSYTLYNMQNIMIYRTYTLHWCMSCVKRTRNPWDNLKLVPVAVVSGSAPHAGLLINNVCIWKCQTTNWNFDFRSIHYIYLNAIPY